MIPAGENASSGMIRRHKTRADGVRDRRARPRSNSVDSGKKKRKNKKKKKKKKDKKELILSLIKMPVLPSIQVCSKSSSTGGFSPAKDAIVLPSRTDVILCDDDLNTSLDKLNLGFRPLARIGEQPVWAVGKIDGTKCVIKSIKLDKRTPSDYDNYSMFEFAMREIMFMEMVQTHPNILPVLAFHGNSKEMMIEMPLTTKGDLFGRVTHYRDKEAREGRDGYAMTQVKTRRVMRQILSGVAHMHSRGVAHRDLKLENVLYFEERDEENKRVVVVKICDFEFACKPDEDDIDILAKFLGSWFSMSPEMVVAGIVCNANLFELQQHFQRKRDGYESETYLWWDWFKSDIWACGIMMYACLHGYFPFYGCVGEKQDLQQMRTEMYGGNIHYRSDLSVECRMVLENMLELTPAKRMSAKELLEMPWFTTGRVTPALSDFASPSGSAASL
jgi:serine/threonine protein kinase